ncbi:hypothetical protein D3C80_656840 [compost metagenome]
MGIAEVDAVFAVLVQFVGQAGEDLLVEVGSLQAFSIDIHQVRRFALYGFLRRFVIGVKVGGIAANLALHQQRDVLKGGSSADGKQRQHHGEHAVNHAAAFRLAPYQTPGQQGEDQRQHRQQADKRQQVFADAGALQAAGEGVDHRIGNAVTGKVVAGDQHHVEDQIAAQQRQQGGQPPAVGGGTGAVD